MELQYTVDGKERWDMETDALEVKLTHLADILDVGSIMS